MSLVHELIYEVLSGIVPAILEQDFDIFCRSIKNLQKAYWKASERKLHELDLVALESRLFAAGARCVAMSSLGPGIAFFSDSDELRTKVYDSKYKIIYTKANNTGRSISYA